MKKVLWVRELSCGHERYTSLQYMMQIYTKSKIGDSCYCRECWKDVKVVKIHEADREDVKELNKLVKHFNKIEKLK